MIQIKLNKDKVEAIYYGIDKMGSCIELASIPQPEKKEGYSPVMYYRNGAIVYEYEPIQDMPVEEEQPTPEMTYEQQVVTKIREKYSVDDELAILRQRDTKPGEFEAYNAYAEACKISVKSKTEKEK